MIFCEGKTADQIVSIAERILEQGDNILATRCAPELFAQLAERLPGAVYHDEGSLFAVEKKRIERRGKVAVVSAGTSDRPVSEEAALSVDYLGCEAVRVYDVGVAGIHRLFSCWDRIRGCDAIIVIAGMEGALASVVAGIADSPVIAVPTSVGYGASFGGVAALLGILNSGAAGVGLVNIDKGFGAATTVHRIARAGRERTSS